jgi:hypothetical protein
LMSQQHNLGFQSRLRRAGLRTRSLRNQPS